MKNKVIYSKISTESPTKNAGKESDSPKLSQSQISVNGTSLQQKLKLLQEENKTLREENEFIKGNNIQYCKQINVYSFFDNLFHATYLKEYELNKMNKIEKVEINLNDLLHLHENNQTNTLIRRLTNTNNRILKEQKDLVNYCNLLTTDFMRVNEKVDKKTSFIFFLLFISNR